ncbi:MAG: hypothetical protein Q8K78_11325 [Planctomycetaceae bacterium]|nr:hypothetical protein [Planctomycetaceae bacterium]
MNAGPIRIKDTFLGQPQRCRMCETPLAGDAVFCERCGYQTRTDSIDPLEVCTKDVFLSVIMAGVALSATLLPTYPIARAAYSSGINPATIAQLIVIGMWNVLVLGCPILFVFRRWYTRVRKGEFNHAWVWRDYWFLQAVALTPVWLFAGIFGLSWLMGQFWL